MTVRSQKKSLPHVDLDRLPLLLGEKIAAEALGVSPSFLSKSRSEGTRKSRTPAPPFVALGGRRYYRTAELKSWVESLDSQQTLGGR